MRPWTVRTRSPEETRRVGSVLGETAPPGGVLLLRGPVGAGKTVLASGVLQGLGVPPPHPSPTFVLVRLYAGRLPVAHLDLYRLGPGADGREFDLDEILSGPGVAITEWAEYLAEPVDAIDVRIRRLDAERQLTLRPRGEVASGWLTRARGAWVNLAPQPPLA